MTDILQVEHLAFEVADERRFDQADFWR